MQSMFLVQLLELLKAKITRRQRVPTKPYRYVTVQLPRKFVADAVGNLLSERKHALYY